MHSLIDFAINNGVPRETVIYILMLPIIATIVALVRQIIGLKTFGIYIPSIVTIVFLVTGLWPGLIIFITVLLVGSLLRFLLKKIRLLYLPRMSLLLILVSLVMLIVIALAGFLGLEGISKVSIFPILIMIILSERFITVQIEKGSDEAIKLSLETLVISVGCYFLLVWHALQEFIIAFPWIIFVLILVNFLLGRWSGLRLLEYYRFREVLKNGKK